VHLNEHCLDAFSPPPGDSAASTHAELQRAREEIRHLTALLGRNQDRAMLPRDPARDVVKVKDLLDQNYIRYDQHEYGNPPIAEDDRILLVDGVDTEHVDAHTLHRMLDGPLHSIAVLTLARRSTGEVYRVEALRHGEYAFAKRSRSEQAPPPSFKPKFTSVEPAFTSVVYVLSLFA